MLCGAASCHDPAGSGWRTRRFPGRFRGRRRASIRAPAGDRFRGIGSLEAALRMDHRSQDLTEWLGASARRSRGPVARGPRAAASPISSQVPLSRGFPAPCRRPTPAPAGPHRRASFLGHQGTGLWPGSRSQKGDAVQVESAVDAGTTIRIPFLIGGGGRTARQAHRGHPSRRNGDHPWSPVHGALRPRARGPYLFGYSEAERLCRRLREAPAVLIQKPFRARGPAQRIAGALHAPRPGGEAPAPLPT
jgi:hypothetical protein